MINGGRNVFSQVDSKDMRKYLTARNSYKASNNAKDSYKVIENSKKYEFKYGKIKPVDDFVVVSLNVKETRDYSIAKYKNKIDITKGASTVNEYTIILAKDKSWKIKSANIDIEKGQDPIDGYYNMNYVLGYSNIINDESAKQPESVNVTTDEVVKDIKEKENSL